MPSRELLEIRIFQGKMLANILSIALILPFMHQASANIPKLQHIFGNPDHTSASYRIPTVHESAVHARRILNLSSIATLSTVFPSIKVDGPPYSGVENRPDGLDGSPIGLMEYYASCGPSPYNPTILAVTIATTIKNAKAGSNVTLSVRYHPPRDHAPSQDPYAYSPANLPRFSLVGHIEPLSRKEVEGNDIKSCFLAEHPDAELWTPGNDIHESWWARLVVEQVYWFGGFGDRAYIGWIPADVYRAITEDEVEAARLVGEKD